MSRHGSVGAHPKIPARRYRLQVGRLKVDVRAGHLEGKRIPKRLVILQFDSFDRAKEWWSSAEYAAAKKLRQDSAITEMILVEGVPPGFRP